MFKYNFKYDFLQLFTTINELLQLNIIPIINTNDAVSPPQQKDMESAAGLLNITDNDSLAARISVEAGADLAILVRPPHFAPIS